MTTRVERAHRALMRLVSSKRFYLRQPYSAANARRISHLTTSIKIASDRYAYALVADPHRMRWTVTGTL